MVRRYGRSLFTWLPSVLLAFIAWRAGAAERHIVVISDLHLGVGKVDRRYHAYEDFRWAADFEAFLQNVGAASPTDLVLNGDTFELWQAVSEPCAHGSRSLGCTEAEAVRRAQHVLRAHGDVLQALGRFAGRGDNRVYLIPGNHDAALLYPKVAALAIAAFQAPAKRVLLVTDSVWRSADGRVVAFHGHQLDESNRYDNWPHPFVNVHGVTYLQRPAGEQIVQGIVNVEERKYPIIDNIGSDIAGVGLALAADGPTISLASDLGRLVRFVQNDLTVRQRSNVLGATPGLHQEWDVAAVQKQGATFLVESLPSDYVAHDALAVAARRRDATGLRLTEDEIRELCDARAMLAQNNSSVTRCPSVTLGRIRDEVSDRFSERLHAYLVDAHATRASVVVLGHTHVTDDTILRDPEDGHVVHVLNEGAWQRTIDPAAFMQVLVTRRMSIAQGLQQISVEQLPACYSFVQIDLAGAAVHFWRNANSHFEVTDVDCHSSAMQFANGSQ